MTDPVRHLWRETLATPLGDMLVVTSDHVVHLVDFADYEDRLRTLADRHLGTSAIANRAPESPASRALHAYFSGDVTAIDRLDVATSGTPFQEEVWAALRRIPAGHTCGYGEMAERLGRTNAARAVGRANGLNPVSIIVPCHRLVGASGSLTGYAGGMERKKWLIRHEARARTR